MSNIVNFGVLMGVAEAAVGFLDRIEHGTAFGWAVAGKGRDNPVVDLYAADQLVASCPADVFRPDLKGTASDDGKCAFEFQLPSTVLDGVPRRLEFRIRGTPVVLTNGALLFSWRQDDAAAVGMARWIARRGLWAIDSGEIGQDRVKIGGWLIYPPGAVRASIYADGRAIADLSLKKDNDRLRRLFWLPKHLQYYQFTASIPREAQSGEIRLSFGNERASFDIRQDYFIPLSMPEMPTAAQRSRVHGGDDAFAFNLEGYSTARKLIEIVRRHRKQSEGLRVLDWGCGCGRVARFSEKWAGHLSGVDIDADNVDWCRNHIGGEFKPISATPPTSLDERQFDLIYGISIFTHLTREYEDLWLKELQRIAKPNALLLMSVHGGVAAMRSGLLDRLAYLPTEIGFLDVGRNRDIDSVTGGSDYYRNTFHLPGYIHETWGKYFDILEIHEGVIGNHQDLVAMTPHAV